MKYALNDHFTWLSNVYSQSLPSHHATSLSLHSTVSHEQKMDPKTFSKVDFKYVDHQPDNQMLKGLKVWPVTEVIRPVVLHCKPALQCWTVLCSKRAGLETCCTVQYPCFTVQYSAV